METKIPKEAIMKDLDRVQNWASKLKTNLADLDTLSDEDEIQVVLSISKLLKTKSNKIHEALGGEEAQESEPTRPPKKDHENFVINKLKTKIDTLEKKLEDQYQRSIGDMLIKKQLEEKTALLDKFRSSNANLRSEMSHSKVLISELQEQARSREEQLFILTREAEERQMTSELVVMEYEKKIAVLKAELESVKIQDKIDA